ncbi:MAG: VanZ family protein [Phycisphaerales bacterium]
MSKIQRAARAAFVLYTIALTVATHWPGVTIEGPVPRPDVWVHIGAFGVWSTLLMLTGWLGAPTARTAAIAIVVGAAWAALDELTQPIFNRHAAWSDWFADVAGVVVGTIVGAAFVRRRTRRDRGE